LLSARVNDPIRGVFFLQREFAPANGAGATNSLAVSALGGYRALDSRRQRLGI
jgi:hypothetical protein